MVIPFIFLMMSFVAIINGAQKPAPRQLPVPAAFRRTQRQEDLHEPQGTAPSFIPLGQDIPLQPNEFDSVQSAVPDPVQHTPIVTLHSSNHVSSDSSIPEIDPAAPITSPPQDHSVPHSHSPSYVLPPPPPPPTPQTEHVHHFVVTTNPPDLEVEEEPIEEEIVVILEETHSTTVIPPTIAHSVPAIPTEAPHHPVQNEHFVPPANINPLYSVLPPLHGAVQPVSTKTYAAPPKTYPSPPKTYGGTPPYVNSYAAPPTTASFPTPYKTATPTARSFGFPQIDNTDDNQRYDVDWHNPTLLRRSNEHHY